MELKTYKLYRTSKCQNPNAPAVVEITTSDDGDVKRWTDEWGYSLEAPSIVGFKPDSARQTAPDPTKVKVSKSVGCPECADKATKRAAREAAAKSAAVAS